jgi:hypothetical protein
MPGRARAAPALAEDLPEQEAIDDLDLEFKGLEVIDFTDLELEFPQESFADELEELEERFAGAAVGLPEIMPGEDGKMMELVPQDFIRRLMISPPLSKPLPDWSVEALRRDTDMTDEEDHGSRKRGTVPRPLTRVHRPESRYGNEGRYGPIRSPERVPGHAVLHPRSTSPYDRFSTRS